MNQMSKSAVPLVGLLSKVAVVTGGGSGQ